MRRLGPLSLLASLLLPAAGCITRDDTVDPSDLVSTPPTSIRVEPSAFLGDDVTCAAVPGAMQSYVATPVDVTDGKALPSSPPLACSATVQFRELVAGHKYRLEIDGYDVAATALLPEGGSSSGSRAQVLRETPGVGAVTPRWTTTCSEIEAKADVQSLLESCMPLAAAATPTGIALDPRATLAGAGAQPGSDLSCKAGVTGNVASFDVTPADASLPSLLNLPCVAGGGAPVSYSQGIEAGKLYGFRIEARAEAGGPVVWGASCSAHPVSGLVVAAVCDPLSAEGALDVGLEAALLAAGRACGPEDVARFDISLTGSKSLSAVGVTCGKNVRFGPLAPGVYEAQIAARNTAGDVVLQASCSAQVEPGAVAVAACMTL
jgi:hypothetical protein